MPIKIITGQAVTRDKSHQAERKPRKVELKLEELCLLSATALASRIGVAN
jgi:hypothetical protein